MVQTIQAKDITLRGLENEFGLLPSKNKNFFTEWVDNLPQITSEEQHFLDGVKEEYLHLIERRPMLEDLVKMVVLSPLLKLAGFYRPPYEIETEKSVTISDKDEDGVIVQGKIDILVLQSELWVVVIESKRPLFSLDIAIPQILAYMLANPHCDKPTFGFISNGSHFRFIKLTKQDTPQYALSDEFTLYRRGNELYSVLSILKRLGELVVR
ncbi:MULTISPECIES: type I restriction enzyme HsdR N-terminal domain-containing protein [Cyanophyceae]|uniref:type I restriction enzyme HsdR N-terminal domain-containing protein n=1 Tax=Cyanophyceae TaxID=3028117 RepID=UPI001685E79B|nr:type I restriction enzyme HsdR N-terminal domain-containing protein [Trichocoleus sp. FACHB-69]MBD1935218.1 restriction endonuclease subunit R [Trichocoleus sp. FACHB-69]